MKKSFFSLKCINLLLFSIGVIPFANAQIGINTVSPKTSFEVNLGDINAINVDAPPGIIAPKVTFTELNQITSNYKNEQVGTLIHVYQIDELSESDPSLNYVTQTGYYYFDGTYWQLLNSTNERIVAPEPWYSSETYNPATSNTENIYQNAQVGIGLTGEIDANAQLELASTNKGLIIPRLTEVQKNAIENPTESMLIWNVDEECFNFYKDETIGWKSLCGDLGDADFTVTNCGNIEAVGNYVVGVATNPTTNYISLSVNVSKPGSYTLFGTTNVGVFFEKTGTFPAAGSYILILPATGSPTSTGTNIPINITINGKELDCGAKIGSIVAQTATYTILAQGGTADTLTIGAPSYNKTLPLIVEVTSTTATTQEFTFNFATNTNQDIQYALMNKSLPVGQHTINLYSNGATLPNTYQNETLPLTITNPNNSVVNLSVPVTTNYASISCSNASVTIPTPDKMYYVAGKEPFQNNYINVTVDVNNIGPYDFTATNTAANVKFTAQGVFTRTGTQTFKAYADKTLKPGIPNTYPFQLDFKGNTQNANCTFNLDVIYPKESAYMAVYGWGISNQFRAALLDKRNFGPTGTFKIEPLVSTANNWSANTTIYQSGKHVMTESDLNALINVYKVKMILITWDVNQTLSDASAAILADFINNKGGSVFVVNGQRIGPLVKKIIDTTYNTNVTMTTDWSAIRAVTLPNLSDNPYINGPFGNVGGLYFASDDYESWVGIDPNTLPTTKLAALVNIPATADRNKSYPARETLIYSTNTEGKSKPGFFLIPDAGALHKTGKNFGENRPIGLNNSNGDSNVPLHLPNRSIINGQLLSQTVGDWIFFGNIMAELIKHSYNNANTN